MSSFKTIGCGMLLILCIMSASMAQDELQDLQPINVEEELFGNVQELLRGIQSMLDPGNKTVSENANSACTCSGVFCTCSRNVRFRLIFFNEYCVLTLRYRNSKSDILTTLTCGRKIKFTAKISLANPKRICVRVPGLGKLYSACLKLDNLTKHSKCVHGCASITGRLLLVPIGKENLGCFVMYYRDQATEPRSALEPSSFETSNWIGNQDDTEEMSDVDDDVVMMEDIVQPL